MLLIISRAVGYLLCVLRKIPGFTQSLVSNSLKRKLPRGIESAATVTLDTYEVLDLNLFHNN